MLPMRTSFFSVVTKNTTLFFHATIRSPPQFIKYFSYTYFYVTSNLLKVKLSFRRFLIHLAYYCGGICEINTKKQYENTATDIKLSRSPRILSLFLILSSGLGKPEGDAELWRFHSLFWARQSGPSFSIYA